MSGDEGSLGGLQCDDGATLQNGVLDLTQAMAA